MLHESQDSHHHASLSRRWQDFTGVCVSLRVFLPSIMVCLPNANVGSAAADFKWLETRWMENRTGVRASWHSIMAQIKTGHSSEFGWINWIILGDFSISIPSSLQRKCREKALYWSSVVDVSRVQLSQQEAWAFFAPIFFFLSVFLGSSPTQEAVCPNKTWKLQSKMSSQPTFWPASQVSNSNPSPLVLLRSSASGLFSTGSLAPLHSAATVSIYIILPSSQKHQVLD